MVIADKRGRNRPRPGDELMKKTNPTSVRHVKAPHRGAGSKQGRWEIKSQSLHTLGADGSLLRPVYRTSSGEVRFLTL